MTKNQKENTNQNTPKKRNVIFNRDTLKEFFESRQIDTTEKISIIEYMVYYINDFYNYFDFDSFSKKDEKTGCYISHLIFQDFPNYNDSFFTLALKSEKPYTLSELKYKICSELVQKTFHYGPTPFSANEKGELYLESVIRATDIDDICVREEFLKASRYYGINIPNHKDYQGNNLLHWIIVTGRDPKIFYEFFEKQNIKDKNNYGISVEDIWQTLNRLRPFYNLEINETDNYINISSEDHSGSRRYKNEAEYYDVKYKVTLRKNDLVLYLLNNDQQKLLNILKNAYPNDKEFKYQRLLKRIPKQDEK